MRLAVTNREMPRKENRALRAILTVVFVIAGMVVGGIASSLYNSLLEDKPPWLENYLAGAPPSDASKAWAVLAFVVAAGLTGFLVSSVVYRQILAAQEALESMSAREKLALFLGLVFGLILTFLITASFRMPVSLTVVIALLLCYLSVAATMSIKEQLRFYYPGAPSEPVEPEVPRQSPKLLDTNVIIDGRILDICRTGFVEGPILIPRFILDELQHIADSSDSLKRARGRRGLDILNQMRKELGMKVTTFDPEGIRLPQEVDSKLVAVAQHLGAVIITNDFNLNKVAELQGVTVLNVNELANALKPVVLPGEEMSVTVIREGKEPNQGVAYLDDGTMVVIENAKRLIGERVDVIVASVWQTVAGKMIFATLKEEGVTGEIQPPTQNAHPARQRRRA
ncbi:MAG: PIN/TRAM domain-containing protein [Armatimonadota bacterium]